MEFIDKLTRNWKHRCDEYDLDIETTGTHRERDALTLGQTPSTAIYNETIVEIKATVCEFTVYNSS